jgi:exonuclease III
MIADPHCVVLNWNTQGLNNSARKQLVRELVSDNACTIVYLQETKLQMVDDTLVAATLGQH